VDHVNLGRTGLRVSRLCLGTMTFGLQCDEERSRAVMDRAFDSGITFFDTADAYPLGGSLDTVGVTEEIVGRWLAGRADDVILATKCHVPMSRRRWDRGNSRRHIVAAVDESLRRLGTDRIDLYQMHAWDPHTPMDETLQALDDLVRAGKIVYAGVSNWPAWRVARSLGRSEARGWARIDSVQPRYNLLFRRFEQDLFPMCVEEGIGCIPYNPLAGGLLTGKHQPAAGPADDTRFRLGSAAERYMDRYWHPDEFATVNALRPLADEAAISLAQLAIGWVLAQPAVTAPILGASRPDQLDDALRAVDKPLEADLLERLDELTRSWRRSDDER
jgi:1-deoxyxylulose-5-phosphate synthase